MTGSGKNQNQKIIKTVDDFVKYADRYWLEAGKVGINIKILFLA
jgi:hypothetical protein